MRSLRLALMAVALAAPVLMAASGTADAMCIRQCDRLGSGGACTHHTTICKELEASVGEKMKALRKGMRCRTPALLCDYGACKPVCDNRKKT
jgi:hypothetical protein